jgi:AraC-like DNA-binding protein
LEELVWPYSQLGVVPREFTLSRRVVQGLVEAVETVGVPRVRLLRDAPLAAEQLDASEFRVPCSEIFRLLELALDLTSDPALGLHWAEKLNGDTFNPVSHMLAHSATLRQAFESLRQFRSLLSDRPIYELVEADGTVTVRCVPVPSTSLRVRRFTAEMLLASLVRLMRSFSPHARPGCVSFDYAAPSYRSEYSRVFAGTERFEQPFSGIVFDSSQMDAISPHKDDDVHMALRSIAEQRLLGLTHRVAYSARASQALLVQLPSGRASMASVARSLGMSVRSLRRRLVEEGKDYSSVAIDAKTMMAKHVLRESHRPIQQVAYELGFAEASSFHRAFKRWTGMTPVAYRRGRR